MPDIKKSLPQATDHELISEQNMNLNSYERLDDRTPFDGTLDKFGEIRLRLATINSPETVDDNFNTNDEMATEKIVNVNVGKVTLRWEDMPGGVIRPKGLDGEWTYHPERDSINPEERNFDANTITSAREMVDLTSPFIWTGADNYCGFNYMPPVGCRVIVGFKKQGFPVILGYLPTFFKALYPVLKPGEVCMAGYGNNYTHWRWSDKIDMKAWSKVGEIDKDDPAKAKTNAGAITIWLRLNANDGYLKMSVTDATTAKSSALVITPDTITITTGTYNLQIRDLINIDAPKITQN